MTNINISQVAKPGNSTEFYGWTALSLDNAEHDRSKYEKQTVNGAFVLPRGNYLCER